MDTIILVDIDNTIADFDAPILSRYGTPDRPRSNKIAMDYSDPKICEDIKRFYKSPGFTRSLDPFSGSIKTILKLVQLGYEIVFCTAPTEPVSAKEKLEWIIENFGDG
jgi:5'(3')-deoxyribonucleotidase